MTLNAQLLETLRRARAGGLTPPPPADLQPVTLGTAGGADRPRPAQAQAAQVMPPEHAALPAFDPVTRARPAATPPQAARPVAQPRPYDRPRSTPGPAAPRRPRPVPAPRPAPADPPPPAAVTPAAPLDLAGLPADLAALVRAAEAGKLPSGPQKLRGGVTFDLGGYVLAWAECWPRDREHVTRRLSDALQAIGGPQTLDPQTPDPHAGRVPSKGGTQ